MDFLIETWIILQKMILSIDEFYNHYQSQVRNYPHGIEVQSLGYYPGKDHKIKRVFGTFNFSFILSGRGFYRYQKKLYPLIAPVVITQEPGKEAEYGPDGVWEEFYVLFPSSVMEVMKNRKIYSSSKPYWKIMNIEQVIHDIEQIIKIINEDSIYKADRIDHYVQGMILNSLNENRSIRDTPQQLIVHSIYKMISLNCERNFNFDQLARDKGISPSSLRQAWKSIHDAPPGQTLMGLRMQKATRLLAETSLPIQEIAMKLGYKDPLYFSRQFHKMIGESPRDYRNRTSHYI